MDSVACADYLVVSQILDYLPVSDLFNTSEVCRLWKDISLGLLRRKLRYLCYCHIKPEEKCPITANGLPKFLDDFCRDLRRFIQIAKQAGCSPTFGFLSYSSNPKDEKAVVQQVQSQLSPRCVVVYHRSKTITMRPRDDPTKACSVHRGITGAFLFGPSPPTPCHRHLSSSSNSNRSSSNPAAVGQAGSSKSCPATEARDVPAPPYRRQCNFKRSRLQRLSKLLRRAVLGRRAADPCLRNVAPGVMLFHSFRIPMEDGHCLTTHWREEHTGRVVAVSFMRLFQALVELFPQVPVMSISGEFLSDEELLLMGEPPTKRKRSSLEDDSAEDSSDSESSSDGQLGDKKRWSEGDTTISDLLRSCASSLSMAVSSREVNWFTHLVKPPHEAQEDLPHVPKFFAVEAMLARNVEIMVMPSTEVLGLDCDSYAGHRARLFPGADGELLVFVVAKETLSECSTRQGSPGRLGDPHQTAVVFRCNGGRHLCRCGSYWTRLCSDATCDPLIKEVLEKGTLCNPRNAEAAYTSDEAIQREVAQRAIYQRGYTGSIGHTPEVVLLRNAMEDLRPERDQHSFAAFAETGDTDAVKYGGGEEHCRSPCTASSDQVCQINDCLPVCNDTGFGHRHAASRATWDVLDCVLEKQVARGSKAVLRGISPARWLQGSLFTFVEPRRLWRQLAKPPTEKAAILFDDAESHRGHMERWTGRCLQAHAIYGCL
ncbi:hypothetical protein HPB50_020338 [Hyalomma asiaticum]|uniref:Uncharacterized protein n=1 Tax=Hyalomma asiaticum TaxID=266040 RepID=A0ACB7TQJ2_HYAAI|nr:hypothetical protein HPB50_020338 [Hyalomma asiaticum]